MSSINALHKEKITVTISGAVVGEIDKIAKGKKAPRSQVMEEMLKDWLLNFRKMAIEKEIETYYLSLTEKEKKDDREWTRIAAESAKRAWND
jgi:metal-responsive CopG/Arc/MetJ family transcriptional regulator